MTTNPKDLPTGTEKTLEEKVFARLSLTAPNNPRNVIEATCAAILEFCEANKYAANQTEGRIAKMCVSLNDLRQLLAGKEGGGGMMQTVCAHCNNFLDLNDDSNNRCSECKIIVHRYCSISCTKKDPPPVEHIPVQYEQGYQKGLAQGRAEIVSKAREWCDNWHCIKGSRARQLLEHLESLSEKEGGEVREVTQRATEREDLLNAFCDYVQNNLSVRNKEIWIKDFLAEANK